MNKQISDAELTETHKGWSVRRKDSPRLAERVKGQSRTGRKGETTVLDSPGLAERVKGQYQTGRKGERTVLDWPKKQKNSPGLAKFYKGQY